MADAASACVACENALDMFRVARAMIEHEDGLASDRVNWLLAFQGLLLNALVGALKLSKEPSGKTKRAALYATVLIALAGVASPILTAASVIGAEFQIATVKGWWEAHPWVKEYPPIIGRLAEGILGLPNGIAILGLSFIWIVLIVVFWCRTLTRGKRTTKRRHEPQLANRKSTSSPPSR